MEIRERPSQQGKVARNTVKFEELRDDWVKAADLLVRVFAKAACGEILLQGFPPQWIPIFVHFGANWTEVSAPKEYVPLASEMRPAEIERISREARARGALRELVECFASLDPLVADVLHKLDRRMVLPPAKCIDRIRLTGWQSYGRPEILALNEAIEEGARADHAAAVLLPCARKRPYDRSRTHKRIWAVLYERSVSMESVDQLVVSSIGIVPKRLWDNPVVTAYDSGVPDIYRILRLMRAYFKKARYERVIDCLEFAPYSDCLQILAREGLIETIEIARCARTKRLPAP